ncbi:hypothetical protein A2415_04835 [candidate division WWE3 bacterium RIFOXYC1_FULL_39_7]|uniref:Uncharacterized protein n=1 Tax=candidate division WWE3 bacterium RIFOXYC1_FULL_39_7 TaxID=1802643 RepID=A0A1F4WGN7_UNCKA|nr:MAG: hypothetical protein A2415_04835 [candidate division WWE3 bacterium RIFOXYC1_FULL_39_7]
MNNVRHIYNDNFYKITAILLSKKFLTLENEIRAKYDKLDLSIPTKGFSNYKEYGEWLTKARNIQDSPGKVIESVLKQFNLDPKNEFYRNCLTAGIFFHKQPWEQSPYSQQPIELITRNNGVAKELWVKIHPWTKKSDYVKLWESIKNIQKTLPGYRGKEKFQTTFKRDFEVYQLYLEVKKAGGKQVLKPMSSHPEYYTLADQFGEGDIDGQLRSIKSRFNKLLAGIDIL